MPLHLKQPYVAKLLTDPELQGLVAKAAGTGLEVPRNWALHGRHHKMIRLDVLRAIQAHTKVASVDVLVEEAPVVSKGTPALAALKSNA